MKYVLDLKEAMAAEGENKLPQDFLMEMMDLNEILIDESRDQLIDLFIQKLIQSFELTYQITV